MKSSIFMCIAIASIISTLSASEDKGWYITRKPIPMTYKELDKRTTNIRDLITDCKERSISLSCHRAGKWFLDNNDTQRAIQYTSMACELGRGYSCRVVGELYVKQNKHNIGIEWFRNGCLRRDNTSCTLFANTTPDKEKSFFEKLFGS